MVNKTVALSNNSILNITTAEVEDAPLVLDFLNMIGGETDYLTFGRNEFYVTLDDEIQLIAKNRNEAFQLMLVGKINGVLVSQLFLDRSHNKRLSHIGEIGVSVSKKYWGLSIGSHMLSSAIFWAKQHKLTKLQLQVRVDNLPAIKLYEKYGFMIEGTLKNAINIENKFYDEFVMGLLLT